MGERFSGGGVEDLLGFGDWFYVEWDGGGWEGVFFVRYYIGLNIWSWKKYVVCIKNRLSSKVKLM